MAFLKKIKNQFFSESADVATVLGVTKLKIKLESLRKEERDAVIQLGYEVLSRGDADKYGKSGENLVRIQEEISHLQNNLREEEQKIKR